MLHCTKASGTQFRESNQGRRNRPTQGRSHPEYGLGRSLAIACLALLLPIAAAANQEPTVVKKTSPWTLCAKATNLIERQEGIPRQLLRAISKIESGRFHQKKQVVMAWPWTVMAEGRGRYLPSKSAAIAEVEGLKARGVKNIDVGCMQVNLYYHPNAFADLNQAFDPVANVAYAASYLKALAAEQGSWAKAVAHYHSANPGRYRQYRAKVHQAWRQEREKYLLALSELQSDQTAQSAPMVTAWHQATVAEPFHMQLASLGFGSAAFEFGIDAPAGSPEAILALAYDAPVPVSIAARETGGPWFSRVAISAREPAGPMLTVMTASMLAREPAAFARPALQPVAIAAREPADPPHPLDLQVAIAAREPPDAPVQSDKLLPSSLDDVYPGFGRAAPIHPGEQWSLFWPLLEPHAERVGRKIFSLLQSLPTESGGNG